MGHTVERCPDKKFYVGYLPGFLGAHSQVGTLDELNENLREVSELLCREDLSIAISAEGLA